MAYDKNKIYNQAEEAIKKHNLFFVEDIVAFLPCGKTYFYDTFSVDSNEMNSLKELLDDNKVKTKSSIRAKLWKSNKASELLALYRLIATPEEHQKLNQSYVDHTSNGKTISKIEMEVVDAKTKIPRWAVPLTKPIRYKGVKGGRGSGKSHFFGERAVLELVKNPNKSIVCIREVQKSLKFSAKKLIEEKIQSLGLNNYFEITLSEIRSTKGTGLIIFQGMQDHTADSIKSLEGFNIAWVEEAQTLSSKSLKLLRPTIRAQDSEIWFSWNPEQPIDPVDAFFKSNPKNSICVHVNLENNPFAPQTLIDEANEDRIRMLPEDYAHVWEGEYNTKSEALIFREKYEVQEFKPKDNWNPLYGLDFGFSQDPTTANEIFVVDEYLYIHREANKVGLELDDTSNFIIKRIPNINKHVIRADSARPESISYLKRKGLPLIKGVKKWSGSVEDGIEHMKTYKKIIIHPRCRETIKEFGLYSYKVDKRTGDILPKIEDKYNHHIDGIRYGLGPLIKKKNDLLFVNM